MYDVTIIGAGVVGCAIARELSKFDLNACVIEREEDVCCGTSKANSAIIHAGFDAKPGTLKAKLNVRGNEMMEDLARDLDFPFRRNGSLVVCTKSQDLKDLESLLEKGKANGVPDLRILNREELLEIEPNIADSVTHALLAPTGGIVCPFHMTIAFAENAYNNGVSFFLNTEVTDIKKTDDGYVVSTKSTTSGEAGECIPAKAIVNAAGVYADTFHNMVSKNKLNIIARKGEYMLLDKVAGNHVSHTVFQLPSKMGKGVLVTPTVHGNLLLGPTATDVTDKEAVNTTAEGLDTVASRCGLSVKNIPLRQVITSFAGLRAHEENGDFVIGECADAPNFFDAAGIESPGLSSAPAIAELLAEEIAKKLSLQPKADFVKTRKGFIHASELSLDERNSLIKEKPAYGTIVCRCEMVSEGEIIDAINRPLGARSLDGVKRRTRAGMGRCQSGFCAPKVMEILDREVPNISMLNVSKSGRGSQYIVGLDKEV